MSGGSPQITDPETALACELDAELARLSSPAPPGDAILWITHDPPGGRAWFHQGQPVWPVDTPASEDALVSVAGVFGARVEQVPSGAAIPVDGDDPAAWLRARGEVEEVVALGDAGDRRGPPAQAQLTGRAFRAARRIDDLALHSLPAVIVTATDQVTDELLDLLCSTDAQEATGLIFGDHPAELRRQVLVRAAAARLCGPLPRRRLDIVPGLELAQGAADFAHLYGGKAAPGDLRAALSQTVGVLTLASHSDGVDSHLGPLVLCPMDAVRLDADRARAPACMVTGHCHRRRLPVEQALSEGALLAPEAIAARIFLYYVCWGVVSQPSFIDHRWGLMPRLLANPAIGAMISSWGILVSGDAGAVMLADALAHGVPVGRAVAAFNRCHHRVDSSARVCLIGDPRVRLPAPELEGAPDDADAPPDTSSPSDADAGAGESGAADASVRSEHAESDVLPGNLAPLDMYLRVAARRLSTHGSSAAQHARQAIDEGRAAIMALSRAGGGRTPGDEAAQVRARRTLLQSMIVLGEMPASVWMSTSTDPRRTREAHACACGHRARLLRVTFPHPDIDTRRVALCARCGIVEDAPAHAPVFSFSIDRDRTVRLDGEVPQVPCAAALLLMPRQQDRRTGWEWPSDQAGVPLPAFRPPGDWPSGPLHIGVLLLWDVHYAMFTCALPGTIPRVSPR